MAEIKKVVSTLMYAEGELTKVRELFDESEFVQVDYGDSEKLVEELKDADVAIVPMDLDERFLGENKLKWIHCDHAGLNHSARPEIFERGIKLTGAAGRSAPVLAEHCIYFMLNACYHTKELLKAQENCQWGVEGQEEWRGLYGRTAGIIGMGNNGKMLAERLHAFGMKLITYDRRDVNGGVWVDKKLSAEHGDNIDELYEESDFIILTVALNDDTYHMLNKESFYKMKDGVVIVNMSRGPLICTEDMIEALENGKIGCAGLDVFEEEPLLPGNPLWKMENVYVTPHVTPQVPNRTARSIEILKENVRRYKADEPLLNQMRQADVYQQETEIEKGPLGIDSKVGTLLKDEKATDELLQILAEHGRPGQKRGALHMVEKYTVRQLFQFMKVNLNEAELEALDQRLLQCGTEGE